MYVDSYVDVLLVMVLPDQCLGENMSKATDDMFHHVRNSLGFNQSTLFTNLMVTNVCDIPLGIEGYHGGDVFLLSLIRGLRRSGSTKSLRMCVR